MITVGIFQQLKADLVFAAPLRSSVQVKRQNAHDHEVAAEDLEGFPIYQHSDHEYVVSVVAPAVPCLWQSIPDVYFT